MASGSIMGLACWGLCLMGSQECVKRSDEPPAFVFQELHMGGKVRLVLHAESEAKAETAARAVYAEFARLEQIMSDYRPESEVSRLCRDALKTPVKVSDDLFEVLNQAISVSKRTGGAFDVTVGPLVQLWREARTTRKLPDEATRKAALQQVGFSRVKLDPVAKTVLLRKVKIDLGGIGKGYANDRAAAILRKHGVTSFLVEAGGDLIVGEAPPGKEAWVIDVQGAPGGKLELTNRALSTSGDATQYVEINGVRYSHIMDPRTGLGLAKSIQVTVLGEKGAETDPFATAFCVLGAARARSLATKNNLGVFIVE